jgi:phosphatidylethanolamine-binding protein (PEBP) family uncharacterized protein
VECFICFNILASCFFDALDVATLNLPPNAPRRDVEVALRGHILGQAGLMGRYGRE